MLEEPTPRDLSERTGKHYCIRCLTEIEAEEFFRNDYLCDACVAGDEFPLASTPEARKDEE